MVGTAGEITHTMQEWLDTSESDGFNVMFPTVPAGLVVPDLQRRGIFRRSYMEGHCARTWACHAPETASSRPRAPTAKSE